MTNSADQLASSGQGISCSAREELLKFVFCFFVVVLFFFVILTCNIKVFMVNINVIYPVSAPFLLYTSNLSFSCLVENLNAL